MNPPASTQPHAVTRDPCKALEDGRKEIRALQTKLESLRKEHDKVKGAKKLAQLEAQVDGGVQLTPEEIIVLQDENRELKDACKVNTCGSPISPV